MKIGMVFPGYGSQFVGMAKELYDESRIIQEYFEEASNCLNNNFVKLCFASSDVELARMDNAYTALFLVSSSLAAWLKQELELPLAVTAGYNIGEYSALHSLGCFSFPDGLYLLSKYATFYQEFLATGSYAGIRIQGLSANVVEDICRQVTTDSAKATIGLYVVPYEQIVTGDAHAVSAVSEQIKSLQADVSEAPLALGLHSPSMDSVATQFKLYMEKVDFKDLSAPLITSTEVQEIRTGSEVKTELVKQLYSPVLWYQTMKQLSPCDIIIEIGPGTALQQMLKALYPDKLIVSINRREDLQELTTSLKKYTVEN
jgi:[acyl-carrier-protein] S-malonyltransferase